MLLAARLGKVANERHSRWPEGHLVWVVSIQQGDKVE